MEKNSGSRIPKLSKGSERRQYERYETKLKVNFFVGFDLETRVNYRVLEKAQDNFSEVKYKGTGQNVSVEGICIRSRKKLNIGDKMFLEVFVPGSQDPIYMDGEIRWCRQDTASKGKTKYFLIGVLLCAVNGRHVQESIFKDADNSIHWSNVLDAIFSNFKEIGLGRKKAGRSK